MVVFFREALDPKAWAIRVFWPRIVNGRRGIIEAYQDANSKASSMGTNFLWGNQLSVGKPTFCGERKEHTPETRSVQF